MPLTPSDVAAKQFRVAFRGYAIDEVDGFLDEVEAEITRLLTAAAESAAGAGAATATPPVGPPAPVPATEVPLATMEGQEAALRTLLLAQRTADQAVAEAREEAEQLLSAARAEAEATLTAAREEAESTRAAAREEADAALARSREQAERAEREVAERRAQALDELERRRGRLAAGVEELQAFEREYRTRLRAYLEDQLRELDGSGGDRGSDAPAAARLEGGAVRIGGPAPTLRAVPAPDAPADPAPVPPTAER